MIKVLLVDDEVLALEYLKGLVDWNAYGFCVEGCATSARKAMAMYDDLQPEVVISDIKMAGMDGLALSAKLKEKNPEVVVVLLSAYQDFEYAKQGIRYGVMDYLLKNELSEKSLGEELTRIKGRIDEKRKSSQISQRYFMDQMIRYDAEDYKEYEEKLGKRLAIVMVHRYEQLRGGTFCEQKLTASGSWLEVARDDKGWQDASGSNFGEWLSYVSDVFISDSTAVFLYRIQDVASKSKVHDGLHHLAERIIWSLRHQDQAGDVVALYSGEIGCSQVNHTFRAMSYMIHGSILWGDGTVKEMSFYEAMPEKACSFEEDFEKLRALPDSLPDAGQYVDRLFGICQSSGIRIEDVKKLISGLEHVLTGLEQEWEIRVRDKENQRLSGFAQARAYYISCFVQIQRRLLEYKQREYSPVVWKTMRYLESHYYEEISLEELGDRMRMNGVYLGQLFKKETGMTCLKYQTDCRMKKAQELLLSGRYHIGEVAEMVGYQTSQYFSKIYQKNMGMTPQEFKKKSAKSEI